MSTLLYIYIYISLSLFVFLGLVYLFQFSFCTTGIVEAIIISGFCFYLFGWHVHEKAILMVTIPLRYIISFCCFLLTTFPLLFLLPLLRRPLKPSRSTSLLRFASAPASRHCVSVSLRGLATPLTLTLLPRPSPPPPSRSLTYSRISSLLAASSPFYARYSFFLATVGHYSLFPLLFTPTGNTSPLLPLPLPFSYPSLLCSSTI